ncbi:MAG: DUF1992 domain-containing protein [Acidimicrobiia bacterium]|nr:DUF1992 domain-containing protein [Acidimicrobiia bacterium]
MVERKIREGQERGEFDDLSEKGKPLPTRGDTYDPDWWVKGLIQREDLDMSTMVPGAFRLRKEAEAFPESLRDLRDEADVRAVLEDYNRRVKADRHKPVADGMRQILVPSIDIDQVVERWHQLRDRRRER